MSRGGFKVYVGKLPANVKMGEVEKIFSRFGTIVNIAIKKSDGGSKAYAFVEFQSSR